MEAIGEKVIFLEEFDSAGFVKSTIAFLQKLVAEGTDPLSGIPIMEEDGTVPGWAEHIPGRDILRELTHEGKTLFFPFSDSYVGEPILCADGKYYKFTEADESEEASETSTGEDMDDDEFEFCMGETDSVGFVLHVDEERKLHIRKGILFGGDCMCSAMVEMEEFPEMFANGMDAYAQRFEKSSD